MLPAPVPCKKEQDRTPNMPSVLAVSNLRRWQGSYLAPDDKPWRYLVYPKYWTLNLRPLMVYPKVLFPPNFIILPTWLGRPGSAVGCRSRGGPCGRGHAPPPPQRSALRPATHPGPSSEAQCQGEAVGQETACACPPVTSPRDFAVIQHSLSGLGIFYKASYHATLIVPPQYHPPCCCFSPYSRCSELQPTSRSQTRQVWVLCTLLC